MQTSEVKTAFCNSPWERRRLAGEFRSGDTEHQKDWFIFIMNFATVGALFRGKDRGSAGASPHLGSSGGPKKMPARRRRSREKSLSFRHTKEPPWLIKNKCDRTCTAAGNRCVRTSHVRSRLQNPSPSPRQDQIGTRMRISQDRLLRNGDRCFRRTKTCRCIVVIR